LVAIYQVIYRHIPTSESLPWENPISVLSLSFKAVISVLLKNVIVWVMDDLLCSVWSNERRTFFL
jgi:nicotinamide riboside kinase